MSRIKPSSYLPPPVSFASKSAIGQWRDHVLAWPKLSSAIKDSGDDFFYVQQMRNNSGLSFGVADGVGGWSDLGVNSGLFSQALMYHSHRYAKDGWAGEPELDPTQGYEEREQVEGWELTPEACLKAAHDAVLRERGVVAGSSTATIINIDASSGLLRSWNLGDSGFSILRSTSVMYKQEAQTHFFNCPKQLAKLPSNSKQFTGSCNDLPSDGAPYQMRLRDGDVIIAYTDGLSDNVFSSEMASMCSLISRAGGTDDYQVQAIADTMVTYSRSCMVNKTRVSPFERRGAREGMYFRGGKLDDVTVIVVLVREA